MTPTVTTETLQRKTQNESTSQLFQPRLYCKKELAKILGVSVKTIDMQMAQKKIEYLKIGAAVRFNGIYLNEKFGA